MKTVVIRLSKALLLGAALWTGASVAQAQTSAATLTGTSYLQDFNSIGSAVPIGWAVFLHTSSTNAIQAFPTTKTAWSVTSGGFKNYASAAIGQNANTLTQSNASDRALGVRQTSNSSTGYDPGAAFRFRIANTEQKRNFTLSFNLQSLHTASSNTRVTTWSVQYSTNGTSWVTASPVGSMTTAANIFSNETVTVDFGTALDHCSGNVYIQIITLTASTGSGNRPASAIDNFTLSWVNHDATAPRTVTFDAGSGACATPSLTEASAGAGVTLPAATPETFCIGEGWTFAGWSGLLVSNTNVAPALLLENNVFYPTQDTTLYAVYRRATGISYDLVTGADQMEDGVYLIGAFDSGIYHFLSGTVTGGHGGSVSSGSGATSFSSLPAAGALELSFTGSGASGEYHITHGSAYLGASGALVGNLQLGSEETEPWAVSYSGTTLTLRYTKEYSGSYARLRSFSNDVGVTFRTYSANNGEPVALFKKNTVDIYSSTPVCANCGISPTLGATTCSGVAPTTATVRSVGITAIGAHCTITGYGF
ncbi:MAG: hypothetical protein LBF90_01250, partial [Prevotellaceae bacterium]|nr:hypothetical protein [Prevotellaceae bacterium]